MDPRIVNIDDQAKAIIIVVGGRKFDIARVTLKMRHLYGEYMTFCGEYLAQVGKLRDAGDAEGVGVEDLEKIARELDALVEDFARGKAERLIAILKELLAKNGALFDESWWADNTDYAGIEAFIVTAMRKDEETGARSKKAEES